VALAIRNEGGTATQEGYFHLAAPKEYGPMFYGPHGALTSDGDYKINACLCVDFTDQIKDPIYPGIALGNWQIALTSLPSSPMKVYYYFSTPRGLQPGGVNAKGLEVRYAELKIPGK